MGRILMNPPVFYMLVQIKFNPVVLKDYIDQIQERLRRNKFADFQTHSQKEAQISIQNEQGKDQNVSFNEKETLIWTFMNFEKNTGFVLLDQTLTFHTTAYTCFEDALGLIKSTLSLMNEVVGIEYIDRIGMRFLNAICAVDGEPLSDHLVSNVTGWSNRSLTDGQLSTVHSMVEHFYRSEDGKRNCLSRVVSAKIEDSVPPMPQELIPAIQVLDLADRFKSLTGDIAVLDTDCSYTERLKFDENTIFPIIESLHSNASEVFESSIRPERIKQWMA